MAYTFMDLAKEVLSAANQPLTVNEVWEKAVETGITKKLASFGKTPINTLSSRMNGDTKYSGENRSFDRVSNRPSRFVLRGKLSGDSAGINNVVNDAQPAKEKTANFKERDLHKILSSYVFSNPHFRCYTTTIFHERSKRKSKGQNSWLHPDIVGVRFSFQDFEDETTMKLIKATSANVCKMFSFELKISVDFSTLREYYFQAVSNSSWANEGYVVALKYEQDPEFLDEMRRLNNAFGIGFIRLDAEDYNSSEIILSAKINENLDWNTISRLSEDNDDFRNFAHSTTINLNQDELCNTAHFDKIFNVADDLEEFYAYVNEKKIKV